MQEKEIQDLIRVVAAEMLNQREAIIQEEFDTRFHDVKLLMKNYRMLKKHYAEVAPETLEVGVICSMHHKTGLMMSHVDRMLAAYKSICDASGDSAYWDALHLRYIADKRLSIGDIAERLHMNRRTYFRYLNRALADLAVLLFGIEAIGTWRPNRK